MNGMREAEGGWKDWRKSEREREREMSTQGKEKMEGTS
jgi:hypothetical protein